MTNDQLDADRILARAERPLVRRKDGTVITDPDEMSRREDELDREYEARMDAIADAKANGEWW